MTYRLSQEIAAFSHMIAFFQQTGDREKRLWAIKTVSRLVKVAPFGSFKYGIYLPWHADLDMVVSEREFLEDPGRALSDLAARLPGVLDVHPKVVAKGRVPFLAVWMMRRQDDKCAVCAREESMRRCPAHSPLLVQISVKTEAHRGLVTSNYVMNLMRSMPIIRPLVQLLKHFLVKAGLNESFNGGLSSYSVILLVVAYLRSPQFRHTPDLGSSALNLFRFYSDIFDPELSALTPGEVVSYRPRKESEKGELLVVLDPIEEHASNAARSFWRYSEFKTCLIGAQESLICGTWFKELPASLSPFSAACPCCTQHHSSDHSHRPSYAID